MKDPDIRNVLRQTVLSEYIADPHSKVVEELRLSPANARVDIAVINGAFHAFEIKSASDTLGRLKNQIKCYTHVFDYITVVTEEKYVRKIIASTPPFIGVSICSENELHVRRPVQINKRTKGFYIAQLLWREEIKALLTEHRIPFRSHIRNWTLCELLAENIDTQKLSDAVRKKLKARPNWKVGLSESYDELNLS